MPCKEFRFQRGGLGVTKDKKRTVSREMGEAFCRWFLTKHADIVWLAAPIDDVRGHGAITQSGGYKVEFDDSVTGDAPDYFCVSSNNSVALAEAKGTFGRRGFRHQAVAEMAPTVRSCSRDRSERYRAQSEGLYRGHPMGKQGRQLQSLYQAFGSRS